MLDTLKPIRHMSNTGQHIARLFRCWFSTMWCTAATVAAPAAMATTQRAAAPTASMLAQSGLLVCFYVLLSVTAHNGVR